MTLNFTSKVLLTLYKDLPKIIAENQKSVLKRAKFNYGLGRLNTLQLYEEIMRLNQDKFMLINLKDLIDKAFALMIEEDRRMIFLRFIKNIKFADIARILGISMRQVFRMYDIAMSSFQAQLEYLKYSAERIEDEFSKLRIYKSTKLRLSNEFGISIKK